MEWHFITGTPAVGIKITLRRIYRICKIPRAPTPENLARERKGES